jgi:hypothetical protein
MQLRLDHATICGSNLEAMRRALRDVGLITTYGGQHANRVTHMDLLPFEDGSYLELIAPMAPLRGASGMMSGWAKLMQADAGAGAWAVQSSDVHREAARLRALGVDVRGPEAGSRKRPDGTVVEWETAIPGPGPAGSVLAFVIQDRTPRSLRVPVPSADTPGTALSGVAVVLLGVRELEASAALFGNAYGWDAPLLEQHAELGMKIAYFPGTPVMLASASGNDSWLADRIARFGECPAAFLLGTPDLVAAQPRYQVGAADVWFRRDLAWFDEPRLGGIKLAMIAP